MQFVCDLDAVAASVEEFVLKADRQATQNNVVITETAGDMKETGGDMRETARDGGETAGDTQETAGEGWETGGEMREYSKFLVGADNLRRCLLREAK